MALSLQELRRMWLAAKTPERRRMLRQLIILAEGEKHTEPRRQTQQFVDRVLAAAVDGDEVDVPALLEWHRNEVLRFASSQALDSRRQARREAVRELWTGLSPAQRRAITGLPFDSQGLVKPPPQAVGPLTARNLTEQQVLEHISPLIIPDGDALEQTDFPTIESILDRLEQLRPVEQYVDRETIARVIDKTHAKLRRIIQAAMREIEDDQDIRDWYRQRILAPLGLKRKRGTRKYVDFIGRDIATINMQQRGAGDDDVRDMLAGNVYVGYTLHSAFAENTRPHHAFRDGKRFYLDDREGSYKPWADRIRPPYWYDDEDREIGQGHGGNCLCFTIPILETPEGDEYSAEFGVRVSGGRKITARDVGTLRTWYNQQRASVRARVIGQDRWTALGDEFARFEDFYHPNGERLSLRQLKDETPAERRARVDRVRAVMDAQQRRHFRAWEDWGYANRFDGDLERERKYLERLRRFMRRLTAA